MQVTISDQSIHKHVLMILSGRECTCGKFGVFSDKCGPSVEAHVVTWFTPVVGVLRRSVLGPVDVESMLKERCARIGVVISGSVALLISWKKR